MSASKREVGGGQTHWEELGRRTGWGGSSACINVAVHRKIYCGKAGGATGPRLPARGLGREGAFSVDPWEGRGCCLLTSPPLGYDVTGLVAGVALGTRGQCDGISVGNSRYKTGEISSCVSFCEMGGVWALDGGPCSGVPWGGQAGWPNQTLLRKCTNFIAAHTYTHTHTPVDRGEHLATGSTEIGGGDGSLLRGFHHSPPSDREGLRLRPHLPQ